MLHTDIGKELVAHGIFWLVDRSFTQGQYLHIYLKLAGDMETKVISLAVSDRGRPIIINQGLGIYDFLA